MKKEISEIEGSIRSRTDSNSQCSSMSEYKTTFDRKATTRQRFELWASQSREDKNHENLNNNLVKTSKDSELNPEAPIFVPSRTLAQ